MHFDLALVRVSQRDDHLVEGELAVFMASKA